MKRSAARTTAPLHLLDGNLMFALSDSAHVHHGVAVRWLMSLGAPFATWPIIQGTLLRVLLQFKAVADVASAVGFLERFTAHRGHRFWADDLPYVSISWTGVFGQRQVTDAYFAALARRHNGRLATFDQGLAAQHADMADLLETGRTPGPTRPLPGRYPIACLPLPIGVLSP